MTRTLFDYMTREILQAYVSIVEALIDDPVLARSAVERYALIRNDMRENGGDVRESDRTLERVVAKSNNMGVQIEGDNVRVWRRI